jgi:Arylsulfotransferase (ASST)
MPRNRSPDTAIKRHLLPRSLVVLSAVILAGSVAALAFGAKRIATENAAYKGPSAPQCVPDHLGRSAILPGTSLSVAPLPDSLDAPYTTQISMLGYPPSALSGISVRGSASGGHSGRLAAYSQGDGASFVPNKPFHSGEAVVVRGKLTVGGKRFPFAFHFTIAERDNIGYAAPTAKVTGKPGEVVAFHSRPELHAPIVSVTASSPGQSAGDVFLAPYSGPGQDGPMIVDGSGNLVWFDPLPTGTESTNLQVQQYEGRPALTWWQGYIPPQGFGQGEDVIADSSYHQVLRIRGGNGLSADLHEFRITPQGTALVTAFDPIRCNLSSVGGPADGAVTDSLFQEIDLKTHLVRREWHPLDHVALSRSYASPTWSTREWPWDYFHLNSIQPRRDGSILISSRNTSALYEISPASGTLIAQIGGKGGSEKLGAGTATAYQHDAEELPNGDFTIFDNGAVPKVHPQSRGMIVSIDPSSRTVTLIGQYVHPKPLSASSQGNVQSLEDGGMFIGWGSEPWFSEYAPTGALVFDAHLPAKTESYRSYRFPWTGTPSGGPSVAVTPGAGGTSNVYASWNGATTVASWRVLAGASGAGLAAAGEAPKGGFETSISTPGKPAYVAVQALDAAGNVLGTSHTVKG